MIEQPERMSAAELRETLGAMRAEITYLTTQVEYLAESLGATLAKFAEMPKPAAASDELELVEMTAITLTYDGKGEPIYHAMGGKYAKFGARIWPEHLEALQINPAELKPGPNPWARKVMVKPATATRAPKAIRLA